MAEMGIDISRQYSKSIEMFRNEEIDLVVSVCQSNPKLVCSLCSSPIVMGRPEKVYTTIPGAKHYVHHGFSDPSEADGNDEERAMAFRLIRDDIKKWIIDSFKNPRTLISDNDV
jgi:arsenate reductase